MVFQIQAGECLVKPEWRKVLITVFTVIFTSGCSGTVVSKGERALELGDFQLAITLFSKVLEHNPADAEARLGIGKAFLQKAAAQGGDTTAWRQALMHLEAARTLHGSLEVNRLVAQVWTERGTELLDASDTLAALGAFSRAIAIDGNSPEPLNLAGIVYYRTGRADNARRLFERALAADSTNTATLFNLGMLYWEEHAVKAAHTLWLRALKGAPGDEELLYWFSAAEKKLRESAIAGDTGQ